MRSSVFLGLLCLAGGVVPALGGELPSPCALPALSDQQVKTIVQKERAARTDLPVPYPNYRSTVRRKGCYYLYMEHGLPEAPEYAQSFTLNDKGVIVDATSAALKCPATVFTDRELTKIVARERAGRTDLPAPFPEATLKVWRKRCLYFYFEYAVPPVRGKYQVFTIDPLGGLLEVSRSEPYPELAK